MKTIPEKTEQEKGRELDSNIIELVMEKLRNKNEWISTINNDWVTVRHKTLDITVDYNKDAFPIFSSCRITQPGHINIKGIFLRSKVRKLIKTIMSFGHNKDKQFVLDYLNGMYVNYIVFDDFGYSIRDEIKDYLKNEVDEQHYVIREFPYGSGKIYFKREDELAYIILKWM